MSESEKSQVPLSELGDEELESRIAALDKEYKEDTDPNRAKQLFLQQDTLLREQARRRGEKIEKQSIWEG